MIEEKITMYAAMNIIAPILLLAVLIFVTIRYWNRKPSVDARAERGARDLREKLNEEDRTLNEGSR
jgi:hypothetical protein